MARRIVAVALWAYFAWYLAAMIALATGGPAVSGPIAAILVIAVDVIGGTRGFRSRRSKRGAAVEGTS